MLVLKFIEKFREPRIVKTVLKKNKVRGLTLPVFTTELQTESRQCVTGAKLDMYTSME